MRRAAIPRREELPAPPRVQSRGRRGGQDGATSYSAGSPDEAALICTRLLEYEPHLRVTAFDAMCDPFFNELKDPATTFDGAPLPALFNFSAFELEGLSSDVVEALIPPHAR